VEISTQVGFDEFLKNKKNKNKKEGETQLFFSRDKTPLVIKIEGNQKKHPTQRGIPLVKPLVIKIEMNKNNQTTLDDKQRFSNNGNRERTLH
jgi:hypothetical protein